MEINIENKYSTDVNIKDIEFYLQKCINLFNGIAKTSNNNDLSFASNTFTYSSNFNNSALLDRFYNGTFTNDDLFDGLDKSFAEDFNRKNITFDFTALNIIGNIIDKVKAALNNNLFVTEVSVIDKNSRIKQDEYYANVYSKIQLRNKLIESGQEDLAKKIVFLKDEPQTEEELDDIIQNGYKNEDIIGINYLTEHYKEINEYDLGVKQNIIDDIICQGISSINLSIKDNRTIEFYKEANSNMLVPIQENNNFDNRYFDGVVQKLYFGEILNMMSEDEYYENKSENELIDIFKSEISSITNTSKGSNYTNYISNNDDVRYDSNYFKNQFYASVYKFQWLDTDIYKTIEYTDENDNVLERPYIQGEKILKGQKLLKKYLYVIREAYYLPNTKICLGAKIVKQSLIKQEVKFDRIIISPLYKKGTYGSILKILIPLQKRYSKISLEIVKELNQFIANYTWIDNDSIVQSLAKMGINTNGSIEQFTKNLYENKGIGLYSGRKLNDTPNSIPVITTPGDSIDKIKLLINERDDIIQKTNYMVGLNDITNSTQMLERSNNKQVEQAIQNTYNSFYRTQISLRLFEKKLQYLLIDKIQELSKLKYGKENLEEVISSKYFKALYLSNEFSITRFGVKIVNTLSEIDKNIVTQKLQQDPNINTYESTMLLKILKNGSNEAFLQSLNKFYKKKDEQQQQNILQQQEQQSQAKKEQIQLSAQLQDTQRQIETKYDIILAEHNQKFQQQLESMKKEYDLSIEKIRQENENFRAELKEKNNDKK